ncbi:MAG: hypothetical protein KatS3mg026_0728 [Bacteroidia bacterium]|nr:MAG: hypothetical protein KatS3mg026_0728 [Bacteroidia bacterium]
MRYWVIGVGALLWGQDTLRVMAYNLLTYGATSGYCDTRCKDQQLRTIVSFVRPHLLGVNEVGPSPALVRRLLDSVLNVGGVSYWRSSVYANTTNSNIVSALFYDSRRFGWLTQELVTTQGGLRDIYAYHLYYKDPTLAQTRDTLFVVVLVSHLKAGNTPSDEQSRAQAAAAIRQYIQGLPPARRSFVLEMGDHNLYSSAEGAYQELTQVLVDPGPAGPWSGNPQYAFFHSQSTRVQSLADGGSGGGLNDRFDFIFFSPACTTAASRARYIAGSHRVIGQDGQHLGKALTDPPLPAGYSAQVINALYAMSDHLPVVAEFALSVSPAVTALSLPDERTPWRAWSEGGSLFLTSEAAGLYRIFDGMGRLWSLIQLEPAEVRKLDLPPGLYAVQESHTGAVRKVMVCP